MYPVFYSFQKHYVCYTLTKHHIFGLYCVGASRMLLGGKLKTVVLVGLDPCEDGVREGIWAGWSVKHNDELENKSKDVLVVQHK